MQIHVARSGQTLGIFSPDEVRSRLNTGVFQPTDLGWAEGRAEWAALSTFPDLISPATPPGPPPIPPGGTASSQPQRNFAGTNPSAPVQEYYPTGAKAGRTTSGTAIASLVCGILGITFLPIIASIPAVICGHIARSSIKQNPRQLKGRGMALAGLIMGYFGFMFILAGIALPVFGSIQVKAKQTKSLAQGKSIAVACRVYAADHGGAFPRNLEELVPAYIPDAKVLTCPLDPTVPVGYEYYGGKDSDPATNILLVSKAATSRFHNRVVIYVDSSGKVVKDMPELPLHKTELLRRAP